MTIEAAADEEWLVNAEALATGGVTGVSGPAALIVEGLIGEARHYLAEVHRAAMAALSPRDAVAFAANVLAQAQAAEAHAEELAYRC